MKMTGADWQALRLPFFAVLLSLLLGAALVLFSFQQLKQAHIQQAKQQQSLREARERLHQSGEEKDKILRYRAAYLDLQQRGFVGEEQRINWVDALRATNLNLKLFGVSYQIEAQQPYATIPGMDVGPYRLQQSVMKISLGLLHEEDLMRFMQALAAQQAGIFVLRECSLQRLTSDNIGRVQPNLQAECELAWLNINENKGGQP